MIREGWKLQGNCPMVNDRFRKLRGIRGRSIPLSLAKQLIERSDIRKGTIAGASIKSFTFKNRI